MASIRISTVKAAAADLKRKAARIDINRDGKLSPSELRAGRAKIGDVAMHGLNKISASMVGNRWYADQGTVAGVRRAIDLGVGQLQDIDAYKGNATHHANRKNGLVTEAEIANYPTARGRLQHMAQQVLWYSDN